ncbi:TetR/AcrR family transcriptional regulator [Nocardia thailandica]
MSTRRETVLDAAIDLLGTRGSRALTHRAVDEAAGVPAGSSSNYFRTREALLLGIAERLEERDRLDWAARDGAPTDPAALVDALAWFVTRAVGPDRARTRARLALLSEGGATPSVAEAVLRGHHRLRAAATDLATAAGLAAEDAPLLVDYLDGLVVHLLPGGTADPRPGIRRLVGALLAQP